ncbi:MAG: universal stress protein [bacterium]|nr:universal stress protein [bacterium]
MKAGALGLELETHLLRGKAHEEIVNLAEQKGVEIIFMESHGRSGITKLVMGSVTEKVIGLFTRPVLVARPDRQIMTLSSPRSAWDANCDALRHRFMT